MAWLNKKINAEQDLEEKILTPEEVAQSIEDGTADQLRIPFNPSGRAEIDFRIGTPEHVLYTETGHGETISGHGYTPGDKPQPGDWVLIKGVTGNILRYRLTSVSWPGEPPTKFEYSAQLDMP